MRHWWWWRPTPSRSRALDLGACLGLAVLSFVAYCVGLERNGLGNPFYAAAVQSGAHNVHNAFFAAINFGGTMSVDKPPLSLWLMEVSVRIFGLSAFGELLPNALAGVATTAVVVLMVREWTSLRWGLIAGLLSLASPMANVMFRFNNPEALLTLLSAGTVWCFSSALRRPAAWKLAGAGVLIAAAVLTKLLAGIVIVPALIVAYAVWAPTSRMARLRHLVLLGVASIICAGWYFVAVALTPASERPWIDGTTDNNPFSLLFSSNVSRLAGQAAKHSVSPPELFRMFHHEELANYGPIIVLAVLTTVAVASTVWLAHRHEPRRLITLVRGRSRPAGVATAAALMNGSALWVCLVMSYIQASYHSYYAVVSTPILSAGTVLNLVLIWRHPSSVVRVRLMLAILLVTAAFDVWVWSRFSNGLVFGLVMAVACAVGLLGLIMLRRPRAGLAALLVVAIALPGFYTWTSWHDHHVGGSPLGGPLGDQTPWDQYPSHPNNFNQPSRVSPELRQLLQNAGPYQYAVALQKDEAAGSIQLATGVSVLPLTGWSAIPNGMFDELRRLIRARAVRYFLPTGSGNHMTTWVKTHFLRFMVGDQVVYDLTVPANWFRRPHHRAHQGPRRRLSLPRIPHRLA
ncbi:putative glycosyltransferase [Nocardioides baekrokdamisoli]|uniref:Putative glycosyltransferase n=1 Tax=Nocardioides baekrokdamisoli TaxID=1804624 RepID=A0A3G9ILY5_9ACTN|nr:glycosyltransferase family 39 protein [Nocardioides baekrokdamisoli]BBH17025.1 putative glycosyltransferase [Nocardioides baekrokdamisoli]